MEQPQFSWGTCNRACWWAQELMPQFPLEMWLTALYGVILLNFFFLTTLDNFLLNLMHYNFTFIWDFFLIKYSIIISILVEFEWKFTAVGSKVLPLLQCIYLSILLKKKKTFKRRFAYTLAFFNHKNVLYFATFSGIPPLLLNMNEYM